MAAKKTVENKYFSKFPPTIFVAPRTYDGDPSYIVPEADLTEGYFYGEYELVRSGKAVVSVELDEYAEMEDEEK